MGKINKVASGLIGCTGLSFSEAVGFLRGLSPEQNNQLKYCADDPLANEQDCLKLLESLSRLAASNPSSVPYKLINTIYTNPPKVLKCIDGMYQTAKAMPFSQTCADAQQVVQALKLGSEANRYIQQIQPWRMPPALDGCSSTDFINLQALAYPFLECLNLNLSSVASGFSSRSTSGRQAVPESTINAAISCLYDPHYSNNNCVLLVNLLNSKLDTQVNDLGMTESLTDVDSLCRCSAGLATSSVAKAVSPNCQGYDLIDMIATAEISCKFLPTIKTGMDVGLKSCSNADKVRAQLVGNHVMDCLGYDAISGLETARGMTQAKATELVGCLVAPTSNNPHCIATIDSTLAAAQANPNGVEAKVLSKITKENDKFCNCVSGASHTEPAASISTQCDAAFDLVEALAAFKPTCNALGNTPPSKWSTVIASTTK